MAKLEFQGDTIVVDLSVLDVALSFHGSFRIPLTHITKAYASTRNDLELALRLFGTGLGTIKTAGIFLSHDGIVFCDLSGEGDCLVLETRGERFPKLAFTLDQEQDPQQVAGQVSQRISPNGEQR